MLNVVRDPQVRPGVVYIMPNGAMASNLRTGEDASRPPAIYVHVDDERSDDEIRASVARWGKV